MSEPLRLEFENGAVASIAGAADIKGKLWRSSPESADTFAILARADEHFIQAAIDPDGLVVEKREGAAGAHWSAARPGSPSTPQRSAKWWQFWRQPKQDRFTIDEVEQMFADFAEGSAASSFYKWVRLEFPA